MPSAHCEGSAGVPGRQGNGCDRREGSLEWRRGQGCRVSGGGRLSSRRAAAIGRRQTRAAPSSHASQTHVWAWRADLALRCARARDPRQSGRPDSVRFSKALGAARCSPLSWDSGRLAPTTRPTHHTTLNCLTPPTPAATPSPRNRPAPQPSLPALPNAI
jgi:hypothetical protein